jgi:hypothetical protein
MLELGNLVSVKPSQSFKRIHSAFASSKDLIVSSCFLNVSPVYDIITPGVEVPQAPSFTSPC